MKTRVAVERSLACSMIGGASLSFFVAATAGAQESDAPRTSAPGTESLTEIVVTGSRIKGAPGTTSASPITSVTADEIQLQQTPEAEKLLRFLPASVPADGSNTNFQTSGAATVNLRGLGPQRNLILLNGKRLVPYNVDGRVDVSQIPLAMIERVDVVTGGASAVYGSDAMSGVVNFITRKAFTGLDFTSSYGQTGEGDGGVTNISAVMGADLDSGRGNVMLGISYVEREGVFAGDRDFGRLGIVTRTGQNLGASQAPPPPAGCGGPNVVAAGGSIWTLPTWMNLAGSPLGQYREDGTLGGFCLGNSPTLYNHTPFNYLETPQEKYSILGTAFYKITDNVEAYLSGLFSHTRVEQLVSSSGVIGNQFWTPLSNPLIGDQARGVILDGANARRVAGGLPGSAWRDSNSNGVVDASDDLLIQYFRRMPELGPRRGLFEGSNFPLTVGLRGEVFGNWDWDVSFQHGESSRREVRSGHVDLNRIEQAVQAVPDVNGNPVCRSGAAGCVPLDLWGGFGAITPDMLGYIRSVAVQEEFYTQELASATVGGPINVLTSPFANTPVAVSFGVEYRDESAETVPDQCIRNAPTSCQGGPNTLPIKGGYTVKEIFGESIIPLISDAPLIESLNLELGYRASDYNLTGTNNTWKLGLSWSTTENLRVRIMQQRAARAPNVGELAAPVTSGIGAARIDYCSVANAAALASDPALRQRCIDTGVPANLIGVVQNLVGGNAFTILGTDLDDLPEPETADTTTIGFVWTPRFASALVNPTISVDYYNIEIQNYIGRQTAQEVLDDCYLQDDAQACSHVIRVQGGLLSFDSGIELFTTNLDRLRAEGFELSAATGFDLASFGNLQVSFTGNRYLTQDFRSNKHAADIDCLGRFGPRCALPTPQTRFVQRSTWNFADFQISYLWRYIGAVSAEQNIVDAGQMFPAFRKIDAQSYFDLSAAWQLSDSMRMSATVTNVFDKDPPLVGNEAGTSTTNFANTFPSVYDTLGRVFTLGVNLRFE